MHVHIYKHKLTHPHIHAVVPSLFGTRDLLHGRQFFQGQGMGGRFWGDSSASLLLSTSFVIWCCCWSDSRYWSAAWRLGTCAHVYTCVYTYVHIHEKTHTYFKNHGSPVSPTEKAMAPHSSTLAWRIPWTEEPGGLPSMGSHRIGHWRDLAAAAVSPNPIRLQRAFSASAVLWLGCRFFHTESQASQRRRHLPPKCCTFHDASRTTALTPRQRQMCKKTMQLLRAVPPTPQSCTRLKSCTYIFEVKYFAQTFLQLVFSFFFPSYYEHGIHLKLYNWIHYCALLSVLNIFSLPIVVDLIFDYLEE